MTAAALAAALEGLTPDQARQIEFVTELCNNIRDRVLGQIRKGKTPPTWDGHELRQLIADSSVGVRSMQMADKRSKRRRDYDAHCLTYNL